jgi:hypothetical protein
MLGMGGDAQVSMLRRGTSKESLIHSSQECNGYS